MSGARRIRAAVTAVAAAIVARTRRRSADPAPGRTYPGTGDRPTRTAHAWWPDPPEGLPPGAVPQQPPAGTPPYR